MSGAETGEGSDMLELMRSLQLTRSAIVHYLSNPDLSRLIEGCFVRVLLELESRHEDYRVGRIKAIERGESYGGFTHDPNLATTIYLQLELPPTLHSINGSSFQLNSISNSAIRPQEHDEWCQEGVLVVADLQERLRQLEVTLDLRQFQPRRRDGGGQIRSIQQQSSSARQPAQQSQQQSQQNNNNTANIQEQGGQATQVISTTEFAATATGVDFQQQQNPTPPSFPAEPTDVNAGAISTQQQQQQPVFVSEASNVAAAQQQGLDLPSQDVVMKVVQEEMRERYAIFPREMDKLPTPQLRLVERELLEHLDRLRELIASTRAKCIVCMDRPPTVITLPCKHKVMCRLCATQVSQCPCCREVAAEIFEALEM